MARVLFSEPDDNIEGDEELIIGDTLKELSSKYPTSENAFLTAAKKRAEEARASVNPSTDEDWMNLAKQNPGAGDSWEASLAEAGNEESQILIPTDVAVSNDEDEDEEEPKLLLF